VVPNGVAEPVRSGFYRAADGGPTLLHLGQLSVEKGVVDLLEAAARVARERPGLRVVLAGPWLSAADERSVRAAIDRLGLADRVELTGPVAGPEKAALFARADVFVLATRYAYEGQPLAVLEAMAAGLPVVATPRGTLPETLAGGAGVIVPEGEPVALAAALRDLAGDPARRARIGAAGRARWAAGFTAERAMETVARALEELRPPQRGAAAPERILDRAPVRP